MPFLSAGIKMYHLAWSVPDLDAATAWARSQRARVTVDPVPAVAFDGRRISFVVFRHGPMVEFIETTTVEGTPDVER